MLARVTAFVVWALVAATAVFWGLRLLARPGPAPAHAAIAAEAPVLSADLGRLLGRAAASAPLAAAAPAPPALASRFRLLGVMAPKRGGGAAAGVALIAVDGKPARAFAPGARVDGDLVLQAVGLRTAAIGPAQGPAALTLEVPKLPAPVTGTLPPPGGAAPVVPVPPPATARPVPLPHVLPQLPPPASAVAPVSPARDGGAQTQ